MLYCSMYDCIASWACQVRSHVTQQYETETPVGKDGCLKGRVEQMTFQTTLKNIERICYLIKIRQIVPNGSYKVLLYTKSTRCCKSQ